jgi:hypothetical protein
MVYMFTKRRGAPRSEPENAPVKCWAMGVESRPSDAAGRMTSVRRNLPFGRAGGLIGQNGVPSTVVFLRRCLGRADAHLCPTRSCAILR